MFSVKDKAGVLYHMLEPFSKRDINLAKIRIAEKGMDKSSADYHQKVVETIAAVQSAYWDLYKSREVLKVRERSYDLTNSLLSKKNIESKLGAIAAIGDADDLAWALDVLDHNAALRSSLRREARARAALRSTEATVDAYERLFLGLASATVDSGRARIR